LFEEVELLLHARASFFEEVYVLNLYKVNILNIDLRREKRKMELREAVSEEPFFLCLLWILFLTGHT